MRHGALQPLQRHLAQPLDGPWEGPFTSRTACEVSRVKAVQEAYTLRLSSEQVKGIHFLDASGIHLTWRHWALCHPAMGGFHPSQKGFNPHEGSISSTPGLCWARARTCESDPDL